MLQTANRFPFLFWNAIAPDMAKQIPPKRKPGRPKSDLGPTTQPMPAKAFTAWQASQGLTDSQAARQLGTSPSTIARYRSAGGSALLGLACAAVAADLPSWNKGKQ